jgi:hypothetical protein
MLRSELEQFLVNRGYSKDKFGHYQKTFNNGETIRYKMQDVSFRRERKARIVDHNEWLRIGGGYYKDFCINTDNKIARIVK